MNWASRQSRIAVPRRTIAEALAMLDQRVHENHSTDSSPAPERIQNLLDNKENSIDLTQTEENTSSVDKRVFKILWSKPSGRKKRVWEGDGQLIIENNTFALFDDDNQSLGTGPAPPENRLCIGSIFFLGSKEIEILEEVHGGNVHSNKKRILDSMYDNKKTKKFKPSMSMQTPSLYIAKKSFGHKTVEPLVMPLPHCENQWMRDKKPIRDVVVDAFLTLILRPHQRQGLIFLYECVMGYRNKYNGAILADEMGLGKSLQCIALIWTLLKHGPFGVSVIRKALVIAPSTLCKTWEREFLKWLGRERLKPFLINNQRKPKEFIEQNLSPVMIISYERFLKFADDIDEMNFQLIVCDEAHRLKNSNNKAAQALRKMSCSKRVLLTGTPVQNDLHEYYVLADITNPGILGDYAKFKSKFEDPILNSQKPDCNEIERIRGEEKAAQLNLVTSSFILRRLQNVLENILPLKTEYVICCQMTSMQKNIYSRLILEWWDNKRIKTSPLSFITILKNICNHPSLLKVKDNTDEDCSHVLNVIGDLSVISKNDSECSSKLIVLKILLKNLLIKNEKAVIVSNSTQMLDLIENECKSIDVSFTRLDGNTPVNHRQRLVDNFNMKGNINNSNDVFLLSARAGGVGLSLPAASRLILFDSDWNPAIDNQAMARIWRDGQRKPVHIYRFLTTETIEEKIYQRQIYKTGLSDAVLDSDNAKSTLKLHDHDLKDLFTIAFNSESSTHDMLQCDCRGDGSHEMLDEKSEDDNCNKPDKNGICSINQLKTWDHFRPEFNPSLLEESCLEGASDLVSFIFRKYYKRGSDAKHQ